MKYATSLVLCLLAACGSDPPVFVDAGLIDGAVVDAEVTPKVQVTVHVRSLAQDGAPDTTARVFLTSPRGDIDAQGQPDAGGTFTGLVTAGGSATVAWDDEGEPYLRTIGGVADGDELWFGDDDLRDPGTMTVTVPARAGANGYRIVGPCVDGFSPSTTIAVSFNGRCGASHALLAHVQFVGQPRQYLVAASVTPAQGATIPMAGTWMLAGTTPVSITGMPAGSTDLTMMRSVIAAGADSFFDLKSSVAIAGGGATATFATPDGFGDSATLEAHYRLPADGFYQVYLFRPTLTEAAPIDVAPRTPALSGVTKVGTTLSWNLSGSGDADAVVVDLADPNAKRQPWRLFLPPTTTSYTVPALPAPFDLAALPVAGANLIEATAVDELGFRRRAAASIWVERIPMPVPTTGSWIVRQADP